MSFREKKGLWLSLAAIMVAIAALVWLLVSGGPRTLIVLFPEVGGLSKEDPVMWRDYTIGRVEKIEPLVDNQIGVTIRIREDYASKITRGARFKLKQASLFGLVGQNAIEIETPSESGLPYLNGERVQGTSLPKPTLVEAGKQKSLEYWEQLKNQAAALVEEYRQSPYRREIEDALSGIQSLAAEAASQTREGFEQFRKSHQKEFDLARQKLEQARDWLRQKGDELGARKLQDEIDRLRK